MFGLMRVKKEQNIKEMNILIGFNETPVSFESSRGRKRLDRNRLEKVGIN